MTTITLTRALNELKLLGKRITKESKFTSVAVLKPGVSIDREDFEKQVKSNYQSVKDLISHRDSIKRALVLANSLTKVTIAGKEYTIAEAVERKTSISFEKDLLENLRSEYIKVRMEVDHYNSNLTDRVDKLVSQYLGSEKKDTQQALEFHNIFREKNEAKLLDPLNLEVTMNDLENEVDVFEAEVDNALSEINAITRIEIS